MKIDEMVFEISNSEFELLDDVIERLKRARMSRAEVRAAVAFTKGDKVKFPWLGKQATGEFVKTSSDKGKVEIVNVVCNGSPESNTHIVDAALVNHIDD